MVYGIFFRNPRRVYIGSSGDYWQRWGVHLDKLRKGRHRCGPLQAEFARQGEWSMRFVVLAWFPGTSVNALVEHEAKWLGEYLDKLGPAGVLNGPVERARAARRRRSA